ncbi:MAG: NADH-quinone oxidoreductase subunit L, partial [Actinobacteria bacterium]|nr:NADH-quinone oxidoreductase subunit L [Actinomycetota bacterium]
MFEFSWLLVVLPLLSALVLILFGSQLGRFAPWLGVASMGVITVIGLLLFFAMISLPVSDRLIIDSIYEWFAVGDFVVPVALQLDPLSMSFVLLVTIVGALIHVYSVSYMSHDPNQSRFFAYMNFFVAAMLLLVLADNYLLLYVGWEGVGLASYLLIGFWQYKPSAAAAAKKAFIVNRVGDLGLALSVMVMVFVFGGVTFELIDTEIGSAPSWVPLVLGLL